MTDNPNYKIMPEQITQTMEDAFWEEYGKGPYENVLQRCYRAMYNAAPTYEVGDYPDCPSHESEDSQNVSQRDQIANLQVECNRLKQVIDNAYLCFQAAYVEGWLDDLSDGNIDNIRDIWHRRIVYAMQELESVQGGEHG